VTPATTDVDRYVQYRDLFETALVGFYVATPDGRLVAANPALARLLGCTSPEEIQGDGLGRAYPSGDREALVERLRRTGSVHDHRTQLRRRDGRTIDVLELVAGEFDELGALIRLRGCLIDVTASARAEAEARERERQFRAVFSDAADPMLILDDRRAVVEANPAAGSLFGTTAAGLVGRGLDTLFADAGDALALTWRELLALGEAKREHRVQSPAGVRLIECSYRARLQSDRHLCIARDITDRRLLEERVMQSEKIESVGRLAGGIAHDFNNLLTAILGYTELLISAREPGDPERADLEEIQRAGSRAAALTQQLLAFGRKQVLLPKDVDLSRTVLGLQAMLTRLIREDIRLVCEVTPAPAVVRIDPGQIEQVILNLVLNARDALPNGGEIRLSVGRLPASAANVPREEGGPAEYVRLQVADNGTGIPPEVRAHLFEPFFTTKALGKGTGLGLASVYGIVRQSNGHIAVESAEGAGTMFTMHFPAVAGEQHGETAAAEETHTSPARETILLVEDEDAVRVIVSAILRRHGYHVLEASTPRGACDIFEHHASEIDLLLTDVVMPEMNGPALAQRLVAARPGLRVLFISGYTDLATPFDASNPNVAFLGKPFRASALADKVREVLARPRRV
jgi:two-component system cell cycle sensor histidine kinase/response regulator CckA